jgi:hypothetical protein
MVPQTRKRKKKCGNQWRGEGVYVLFLLLLAGHGGERRVEGVAVKKVLNAIRETKQKSIKKPKRK